MDLLREFGAISEMSAGYWDAEKMSGLQITGYRASR